ncbi:LPXTG cell wall anchor domain-containing protein [Streptomyces mashuensis]|uniref:LPXTG cell wall anchor domain-containing protein n=1 Tax=Streptomyces mashuensis TaxID=33904 RepID=A0A919EFE6_9ACTN|nr:SCO1860 family LAETG-anchored protein [Streptomyces mashuensis]GHF72518.1 LPXTG cell wall anchor domain-containing protein [Streptomyces mashuensis]
MSSTTSPASGMPAHRRLAALTAVGTATALTLAAAPAAHATGSPGTGTATATVLRTNLDVSLLGQAVHVPVEASLNDVKAPADADRTALAVTLDGVENGRPVSLLRADTATARATTDATTAKGYVRVVGARVHVPGLPLRSLVEVQQVTAEAVCTAGRAPTATATVLGSVSVLGKKVTLTPDGPTKVTVPGVGDVRLELSKKDTGTATAAATALGLDVTIDPLALGVAKVTGHVTLAGTSCRTPAGASSPTPTPAAGTGPDVKPQAAAHSSPRPAASGAAASGLAETGGSSATPYVAGAAGLLVVGGGGALIAARRRAAARSRD